MTPSELLNPSLESILRVSIREERLLVNELHVKQFWDEERVWVQRLNLAIPITTLVLSVVAIMFKINDTYAVYCVISVALGYLLFPITKWLYRRHNRGLIDLIHHLKNHPYTVSVRFINKTVELLDNNPYPVNVYQFKLTDPEQDTEAFIVWDTVVYFQFLSEEDYILAKLQFM